MKLHRQFYKKLLIISSIGLLLSFAYYFLFFGIISEQGILGDSVSPEYCNTGDLGLFCLRDFSFDPHSRTFRFTLGPSPIDHDTIITELNLIPTSPQQKPSCWLNMSTLPPEIRSADPAGLFLQRVPYEERQRLRREGSWRQMYFNLTLDCTEFATNDVTVGTWKIISAYHLIPAFSSGSDEKWRAGKLTERFEGEGELRVDRQLKVSKLLVHRKQIEEVFPLIWMGILFLLMCISLFQLGRLKPMKT